MYAEVIEARLWYKKIVSSTSPNKSKSSLAPTVLCSSMRATNFGRHRGCMLYCFPGAWILTKIPPCLCGPDPPDLRPRKLPLCWLPTSICLRHATALKLRPTVNNTKFIFRNKRLGKWLSRKSLVWKHIDPSSTYVRKSGNNSTNLYKGRSSGLTQQTAWPAWLAPGRWETLSQKPK